jgi:hypothetical protein
MIPRCISHICESHRSFEEQNTGQRKFCLLQNIKYPVSVQVELSPNDGTKMCATTLFFCLYVLILENFDTESYEY